MANRLLINLIVFLFGIYIFLQCKGEKSNSKYQIVVEGRVVPEKEDATFSYKAILKYKGKTVDDFNKTIPEGEFHLSTYVNDERGEVTLVIDAEEGYDDQVKNIEFSRNNQRHTENFNIKRSSEDKESPTTVSNPTSK